jgi:hypothetical protein
LNGKNNFMNSLPNDLRRLLRFAEAGRAPPAFLETIARELVSMLREAAKELTAQGETARAIDELLAEMTANGERASRSNGGANIPTVSRGATPSTLSDLGIPRRRASRAMQLAAARTIGFSHPAKTWVRNWRK